MERRLQGDQHMKCVSVWTMVAFFLITLVSVMAKMTGQHWVRGCTYVGFAEAESTVDCPEVGD